MGEKNYFIVATLVFGFAGLLHLVRVLKGWDIIFGGVNIPMWISWILVVITGVMCYQGIKFIKNK